MRRPPQKPLDRQNCLNYGTHTGAGQEPFRVSPPEAVELCLNGIMTPDFVVVIFRRLSSCERLRPCAASDGARAIASWRALQPRDDREPQRLPASRFFPQFFHLQFDTCLIHAGNLVARMGVDIESLGQCRQKVLLVQLRIALEPHRVGRLRQSPATQDHRLYLLQFDRRYMPWRASPSREELTLIPIFPPILSENKRKFENRESRECRISNKEFRIMKLRD